MLEIFFNEDRDLLYGSLEQARREAIQSGSLADRKQILHEWRNWQIAEGSGCDIRPSVNDHLGANVNFPTSNDARAFMNRLYDDLIAEVRRETSKEWKP